MLKRLFHLFPFKKMLSQKLSDTCYITLYAERMPDKWKKNPYLIWLLRRCDSKLSTGNEVLKTITDRGFISIYHALFWLRLYIGWLSLRRNCKSDRTGIG